MEVFVCLARGPKGAMKVLLVSTGSGSQGGGEFYLHILAKALGAQGHDVHIAIPGYPRMKTMCERCREVATVHLVGGKNTYDRRLRNLGAYFDLRTARRYRDLFNSVSPDIIHINQQVLEDGLDVIRAARKSGYPFVITTHVTYSARELGARFGWLRDCISEFVMNRLDCLVITVSETSRDLLVKRLTSKRSTLDRLRVIHNGVEPPSVQSPERTMSIRKEWGINDETPVIGVVGRIEQQKNPMFFVRLLAALQQKGARFSSVWIGDGHMREQMLDEIDLSGLGARFRIDGWRDDVDQRLFAMDIFVLPSEYEGLPFALQEAMYAGLPVCVSEVDGMREVIEDGLNGYLCKSGSLEHWMARIDDLLADKVKRREMGRLAREFAEKHFSTAAMARATTEVYRQAISQSRSAS